MVAKLAPYLGDQSRLDAMKTFIESYWRAHHFSPSVAEICVALATLANGNKPLSASVVNYYRVRLEREGWLEPHNGRRSPRSFVPAEIFRGRPVFPADDDELDKHYFTHMPMIQFEKD